MMVLEAIEGNIIKDFLPLLMQTEEFYERAMMISEGSLSPTIKWKNLAKQEFWIPSLKEQEKLLKIIKNLDETISKTQNLMEQYLIFKNSTVERLLTKGIGHTKFKKVKWLFGKEIEIPEKWQIKKIESISKKLLGGGTPSTSLSDYWDGNIPWTKGATLTTHYIVKGERFISKLGLENSSASLIPANNILVSSRVSIGNVSINKIDIAINQDVTGIIPDMALCNEEFLYWNLLSGIHTLVLFSRGTTIQGFTRKDLADHKIILPPLDEQKKIVSILSEIDENVNKLIVYISSLKMMKKSILSEKLTPKKTEVEILV